MQIKIPMKINSEKKHSVRYDAVDKDAGVTSIYVMRTLYLLKFHKQLLLQLKWRMNK